MGKPELVRFESADALAVRAAEHWLQELRETGARRFSVALSGGRIADKFYAVLAQLPDTPELLRKVDFFWGDERCVPPSDPESNFRLAQQALLLPLGIAAPQVHRILGELPPAEAAAKAEADMRQHVRKERAGQPLLDLVLLGMGEDGHVASLFPGESEENMKSSKVYRAVIGPKPPPNRVTLGYAAIAAARQVWALVSGGGKQAALARSLEPNGNTPLARVLARREVTRIYTDVLNGER